MDLPSDFSDLLAAFAHEKVEARDLLDVEVLTGMTSAG